MTDKSYTEMTDSELMREVGRRLKALRGSRSQGEVANEAHLTRQTVSRAEQGDNPTLLTLIRLLRAGGRLGALEAFIPEPRVSPIALLKASKAKGSRRG